VVVLCLNGLGVHLIPKNAHSALFKAIEHSPNVNRLQRLEPSAPGDFTRFMVVRHPLDRIISAWTFFCHNGHKEMHDYMYALGYRLNMTFEDFLKIVLVKHQENNHTQKQIDFTGGHKIDILCPIERLDDCWKEVQRNFNMGPLPQAFNASKHEPWQTYYTTEQRRQAENVFAEDLELYLKAKEGM